MDVQDISLFDRFPEEWKLAMPHGMEKASWDSLNRFLEIARSRGVCFPSFGLEFQALSDCAPSNVKVVVVGQDPYHAPGQAHGLAFSVLAGTPLPPSLRNIMKELKSDLGVEIDSLMDEKGKGVLSHWSQMGVLLLNDVLTVAQGAPGSHQNVGWETLTESVFRFLSQQDRPMVFILWGKFAQAKRHWIHRPEHLVIQAPHPSPLSAYRGFFGSKPFSRTNDWLVGHGSSPIIW
ncbi:MAG: uracil-DNA glycosylase [Flavobacteriales bacterium]|nr:uracil-DNA glycosylase [Flavobacteriales bacterium]